MPDVLDRRHDPRDTPTWAEGYDGKKKTLAEWGKEESGEISVRKNETKGVH